MSLHPPHAFGEEGIVPSPAFPFCSYGSESTQTNETVGAFFTEYEEQFCNAFQTTFNEHGLCYTFNNADQGLPDIFNK